MLVLNKNILTIGGNRLEGGPLIPPEPPGPSFDEVTIGTQTWMAKNLSIDDDGSGITIKDNVTANGVNFGTQYYYNWDAAVRVANSIEGWHLPTDNEWFTLINYIGTNYAGTILKSTSGWNNGLNGTDDYGFTGYPVGIIYSGSFMALGRGIYFWTSTSNSSSEATAKFLDYSISQVGNDTANKSMISCSVRLVKDT